MKFCIEAPLYFVKTSTSTDSIFPVPLKIHLNQKQTVHAAPFLLNLETYFIQTTNPNIAYFFRELEYPEILNKIRYLTLFLICLCHPRHTAT